MRSARYLMLLTCVGAVACGTETETQTATTGGATSTSTTGGGATGGSTGAATTGSTSATAGGTTAATSGTTTGSASTGSTTGTTTGITSGGTGSSTTTGGIYTLSVTLTGLADDGESLSVHNSTTGENITFTSDGTLTFAQKYNEAANYMLTITASPTGTSCTFNSSSGASTAPGSSQISGNTTEVITCGGVTDSYLGVDTVGLTANQNVIVGVSGITDVLTFTQDGNQQFPDSFNPAQGYTISVTRQPADEYCTFDSSGSDSNGGEFNGASAVTETLHCNPRVNVSLIIHGENVGTGSVSVANDANVVLNFSADGNQAFSTSYAFDGNYTVRITTASSGITCQLSSDGSFNPAVDNLTGQMRSQNAIVTLGCAYDANYLLGQASYTDADSGQTDANYLSVPFGNGSYTAGGIYIPDSGNNRIMVFDPDLASPTALFELGQDDFSGNGPSTQGNTLSGPKGIAVDGNTLLVADASNARVLVYTSLPTDPSQNADFVLGQPNFVSNDNSVCSAATLASAFAVAIVQKNGSTYLMVADLSHGRLLIYDGIPTSNGVAATTVLGQPDMTTCGIRSTPSAATVAPTAMWSDGNRLIATDAAANRVLVWNTFPPASGSNADVVLGQPDFTSFSSGTDRYGLTVPTSVLVAQGMIWVSDQGNNRILGYNDPPTSGAPAVKVIGQCGFESSVSGTDNASLSSPSGLTLLPSNNLLVTDTGNSRVLLFPL